MVLVITPTDTPIDVLQEDQQGHEELHNKYK
jgi:hypothetical protein